MTFCLLFKNYDCLSLLLPSLTSRTAQGCFLHVQLKRRLKWRKATGQGGLASSLAAWLVWHRSWAAVLQGLDHQSLSCFAATVTLGTTGITGYLKGDNFSQSNLCPWEIPVHPMLCRCSGHSVSWKGEFFQPLLTISGFASSLQVKHWECFTAMWGDLPPLLTFHL